MKRNIDLTTHNDFGSLIHYVKAKPWVTYNIPHINAHYNDEDYDHMGVYQGNASLRKSKVLYNTWHDMIHCDRCGGRIYPYYHDTLCQKCSNNMNYNRPSWVR